MPSKSPATADELLPYEGSSSFRTTRPSLLDAIDVLDSQGWPLRGKTARVSVARFNLPSGNFVCFVAILADFPAKPNVGLPPCTAIRASDAYNNRSLYDPVLFDEAQIDEDGNVELVDGRWLHNCEAVSTVLAPDWTPEKRDVVNQLIAFLGAEKECLAKVKCLPERDWAGYAVLDSTDSEPVLEAKDGTAWLITDYSAVRNLDLTGFKLDAFWQFHKEKTKHKKQQLSRQTVANILRHAGIRIPGSAEFN